MKSARSSSCNSLRIFRLRGVIDGRCSTTQLVTVSVTRSVAACVHDWNVDDAHMLLTGFACDSPNSSAIVQLATEV